MTSSPSLFDGDGDTSATVESAAAIEPSTEPSTSTESSTERGSTERGEYAPPTESSARSVTWNPDHYLFRRETLLGMGVPFLSPFWDHERDAATALYRPFVIHLCETFEPPEDARYGHEDRRLWRYDSSLLVLLRKYAWLGEVPGGKRAWVGDVLRGDLMNALRRRGKGRLSGSAWSGKAGEETAIMAVLYYLRTEWGPTRGKNRHDLAGLKWGSPERVERMVRRGGRFTYYCWTGLSSAYYMLQTMFNCLSGHSQHPSPEAMAQRARAYIRSLESPYDLRPAD